MGILRLCLCFLSLILCAQSLSTPSVRSLEPVEGFEILHSGTHLQSLKPNLVLNERGHNQPFPDDLHVKFQAFGRDYQFDVTVDKHLLVENAKSAILDGDRIISEEPLRLTSYRAKTADGAIVVTITPEHLMHALLVTDNEILQIDPVSFYKHELQGTHALLENEQSKLLVFKHSDLDTKDLRCGALQTHVAPNADAPIHLEALPTARNLLAMIKFNDTCFTNFNAGKNMTMSFGIDYGFQRTTPSGGQPSCTAATAFVTQVVALMNTVYYAQFNIWLHLKGVLCQSSTSTTNWAYDRTVKQNCPDISSALGNFSTWHQSMTTDPWYQNGAWMMATDCYPPAGTVGLAWIGGLCRKYYGSGVSSMTGTQYWLVVAHELGHNFGASHSFQEGQGTTGGIMDYGDSTYQGTIQMHPVYTQADICAQIRKSSSSSTCGSDCVPQAMCWNNYSPTCGNGIIEPPEACDDGANNGGSSSCCTSTCVAKAGIECTSGECCLNCMYATGNTSCSNNAGYCSKGVCKSTTCATYSFPYCGTDTNPCKYRCVNTYSTPNVCSNMAGWRDSATQQPFNMNYTDGTICSRSPYSVCTKGVCVASAQSYSWTRSTWSSCSVTCGTGTQTASVWCANQAGTQVATSFCTGSPPASTQSCTPATCLVYQWKADDGSAWSACTKDCGTGWQSRPIPMCYEQSQPTVAVSASLCGTVPATNRTCNTNACPVAWVITSWNACTVSCGTGTQSPKVSCMQTQNGVQTTVADSLCTAAKPGNQTCNTQACTTYSWVYGTWAACSVTCGGGTQTRSYDCRDNNNAVVASTNCAGSPVSSQSCSTSACPNYQWNVGAWGTCTLSCGGGVQNRAVVCVNTVPQPNTTVADYLCTTTKPSVQQSCNTAACPAYSWVTSSWTSCPVTCGTGTVTRTVTCRDTANNVDAPGMCNVTQQPVSSQSCNPGACPSYSWWLGAWGTCSLTCGNGTQTRTAYCINTANNSQVVPNINCGNGGVSPYATSQACNTDPCASYNWVADATWTTCSKVCGGGTQTRNVKCMNTVTNVQASSTSLCTTAAPATQQACNTDLCPGYWYTGSWGLCSLSCGSGIYTRTVECRDSGNQTVVATSRCTGAQPSSSGPCNTFACPAWNASSYGPCSAPCGDGLMTRSVICWDSVNGVAVASTQCTGSAPSTQAPCNVMPCPNWAPGQWGPCSVSCGGGSQTRTLTCAFPTDYNNVNNIVPPDSLCPSTKPATTQACGTDTCPTYFYSVAWGTCSTTCGDGTQTGTVSCINSLTNAAVAATNCVGSAPASTRTCNVKACATPTWVAVTDWSACNGICLSGTKTRQTACVDTVTNTVVPSSQCTGTPLATIMSCPQDYTCKAPAVCRNVTTGNFCKCPLGSSGDDCSIAARISNVNLDLSLFPNGVPLGETVSLTWTTIGNMPFTAVLLDKSTWKYPKYITAQAINDVQTTATQRTYAWRVDSGLPVGADYSIIVYFSTDVQAVYPTNGYFQIADPCAYISCNGAGTCNSTTASCNCLPGYDGANCQTSPCAKCNPNTSTCQNDGATRGFCTCNAGWTGETCDVPSTCTFSCQNGGIVSRNTAVVNNTVSCNALSCNCKNFYSGTTCQYCGLTCKHGSPDSSCLTCQCGANSGWMGRDCGCQYYILSVHVKNSQTKAGSGTSWVNNADDLASFKDGFSQDIAASLGVAPKRIIPIIVRPDAVDGPLKDYVEVLFLLTQDCVDFAFMSTNIFDKEQSPVHFDLEAYDRAIAAGNFRLLADTVIEGEPTLDELVAKLQAQFNDGDSLASRGFYSSGVLTSAGVVLVPTDQGPAPPPKKSKWIDNNYWVIIVVIGGVAALALGLVCLRRWKASRPIDYNHESVPATSAGGESTTNTRAIYMEELGKKDQAKAGSDTDLTSPELPAGWTKMFEERTGQYYYYNTKSGVSQWELPTTPA